MSRATKADQRILNSAILFRILQLSICLCGLSFIAWAFIDSRFRDAEGFLQGEVCLPVAVGIAFIVFGWAVRGRLKRPAFWFALALVAQAVALQMIDAGPFIRYQHYKKPLSRLLMEIHPIVLIFFSLQTALVLKGLKTRWTSIR